MTIKVYMTPSRLLCCKYVIKIRKESYPIGSELNVYKTFKRRPGGLLNILCTLNLRPVSTEQWMFAA